ncbi:hypothetical protein V3Q77_02460 [Flavobacterium davisii]
MKPEKDNLKAEIKHRLSLLEESMTEESKKPQDENNIYWFLAQEHSANSEFLKLIDIFGNRIGFEEFEVSKFTPILDYETKEPLKIGDKVEDPNRKVCGTLIFDDYNNKYLIKTETGGNHHATTFHKIESFYDYNVDSSKAECRARPHKKRW